MSNTTETHFTVYTAPSCVQCFATKREIKRQGGTYDEIDLTAPEQAEALEEFKGGGSLQMPVVVGPDSTQWNGFRPDLIKWYFTNRKEVA